MVGICRQEDTTGGLLPRKGERKRACELCPPRPQKHAYEQEHASHHDCSSATLTTRPRCQLLLAQEGSLYVVLRAPRTWLAVSKTETKPCCTHKSRTHTHTHARPSRSQETHTGAHLASTADNAITDFMAVEEMVQLCQRVDREKAQRSEVSRKPQGF